VTVQPLLYAYYLWRSEFTAIYCNAHATQGIRLDNLAEKLYTLREVVAEVRDKTARYGVSAANLWQQIMSMCTVAAAVHG
jgi:hypothetical protein